MNVLVKNLLGRPCKTATVEILDIKRKTNEESRYRVTRKTNEEGIANFSVKDGEYLINISFKNIVDKRIIKHDRDEDVKIKLNTIWGLIRKIDKVSDSYLCSFCRYRYNDQFYDKFKCSYCGKSHCSIHRLPENHQCYDTKQPSKDFRTIYDGDRTIIK